MKTAAFAFRQIKLPALTELLYHVPIVYCAYKVFILCGKYEIFLVAMYVYVNTTVTAALGL